MKRITIRKLSDRKEAVSLTNEEWGKLEKKHQPGSLYMGESAVTGAEVYMTFRATRAVALNQGNARISLIQWYLDGDEVLGFVLYSVQKNCGEVTYHKTIAKALRSVGFVYD